MLQAFDAGSPMFNMYFPAFRGGVPALSEHIPTSVHICSKDSLIGGSKNTMYCQFLHPKNEMIILNQLSLIDCFAGVKSLAITSSWLVVSFVSVSTLIWDDPH